jgi:hypothetical protein
MERASDFMSSRTIITKTIVIFAVFNSCAAPVLDRKIKDHEGIIILKNHLKIKDTRDESLTVIASAIMGRSEDEAISIADYIKYKKIFPVEPDKIFVPGDGSLGSYLIERSKQQEDVEFIVIETGIEDEREMCEKSLWKLKNGSWLVRRAGAVACPCEMNDWGQ